MAIGLMTPFLAVVFYIKTQVEWEEEKRQKKYEEYLKKSNYPQLIIKDGKSHLYTKE